MLQEWLNIRVFENKIVDLCWFVGVIIGGLLVRRFLSMLLSRWLFKFIDQEVENVPVSEFVRLMLKPFELIIALVSVYLAVYYLKIPRSLSLAPATKLGFLMVVQRGYLAAFLVAITFLGVRFIKFAGLILRARALATASKLDDQLVPFVKDLLIVLWVTAMFFAALGRVFEVNVLTLITSLGIGGLAVALAARETLENLFASFAIMFDRPFVVGDAIIHGTTSGEVERIGFRSVRIRTDEGSLVNIPNRLVIAQAVDNQSERNKKRVKTMLRFSTATTTAQMKDFCAALATAINAHELATTDPENIRFDAFGDQSLDVSILYFIHTSQIKEYNQLKQIINFETLELIAQFKLQWLRPEQVVLLAPDPK